VFLRLTPMPPVFEDPDAFLDFHRPAGGPKSACLRKILPELRPTRHTKRLVPV
jgi:hypothetical protein